MTRTCHRYNSSLVIRMLNPQYLCLHNSIERGYTKSCTHRRIDYMRVAFVHSLPFSSYSKWRYFPAFTGVILEAPPAINLELQSILNRAMVSTCSSLCVWVPNQRLDHSQDKTVPATDWIIANKNRLSSLFLYLFIFIYVLTCCYIIDTMWLL